MNQIHIIPNEKELNKELELAEKYNLAFEYNEFFYPGILDDDMESNRLVNLYKSQNRDRSKDTLHGVFFDITIHSSDSKIRAASDYRIHQSMEIAAKLGVRGVVFHTNTIPNFTAGYYIDGWVNSSRAYYEQILKEYDGIEIYIENMFDCDFGSIKRLSDEMSQSIDTGISNHFGVCLDYAHAAVFGKKNVFEKNNANACEYITESNNTATEWFRELACHIKHMHINDNDLVEDLHLALGDGMVDWSLFKENLIKTQYKGSILLEVAGLEKQIKSLEFIEKLGLVNKC